MKKTYHGSCHCGGVRFEADLDLARGTMKCNCTLCWKQRRWSVGGLADADFRLVAGEALLGDHHRSMPGAESHHRFCSDCGIATHSHGRVEALGGPFLTVSVAVLDDLPTGELLAAPVTYMDGLHDDWQHPPAETRQL